MLVLPGGVVHAVMVVGRRADHELDLPASSGIVLIANPDACPVLLFAKRQKGARIPLALSAAMALAPFS